MAKVTSFDVARRAGVSQPTVSRALRQLPGASAETRARVLAAARELSYIPSDSGRALSTQRSRRVAVVSEELTNPFYPELVEPISRELEAIGLQAVVVTHAPGGTVGLDTLADGSYDAAILTTAVRDSSLPRDLSERGLPYVHVNRLLDQPDAPSCANDNRAGMFAVSDLLAELGHQRVASLQGPVVTSTGKERAIALRDGLRRHGIALPRKYVARVEFSHDAGAKAARDLLSQPQRPTAIVCGNDVVAFGALSAARTLGLSVPAELTVIGFDDIRMAAWPMMDLTTVHCDLNALAATAVSLLRQQIADPGAAASVHRIPVTLVRRGTHAPPPPG